MRITSSGIGLLLALMIISACAHTLEKPEWRFEKKAIRLHLKAANDLNLYNNKAHTLYLCIYQLEALGAFEQLSADPQGIRKLLECRMFDDQVAAVDNKVLHAGEDITLTLDRADRARFLALVAGYSSGLTRERVLRHHKYQVYKFRKRFFKPDYQCAPCELAVEVSLGAHQIEYSRIIPNGERECMDECR